MGKGLHFGVSHNECLFNIQLIVEPYFVSSTGLGLTSRDSGLLSGDPCQHVKEEP